MYGFRLNKLIVTGSGMPSASIKFKNGLNVISGPTNTGKSWLFNCLSFVLGSSKVPKAISESEGYTDAYLEIQPYEGSICTLKRQLKGGDIELFSKSYESILDSKSQVLAFKNVSKDKPLTISSFLLNLCGFNQSFLTKNESGQKEKFTFSLFKLLLLANEVDIITEGTPIKISGHPNPTTSVSLFNLLLTGKGDSENLKPRKKEVVQAGQKAESEILSKLINSVEKELLELPELSSTSLEQEFNQTTIRLNRAIKVLNTLDNQRRELSASIMQAESEHSTLAELKARFDLLKIHYTSDIERLTFITEGLLLFDELQYIECPFCNTPLSNHNLRNKCDTSGLPNELMIIACHHEKISIQNQLSELQKALDNVATEQDSMRVTINQLSLEHNNTTTFIDQGLAPEIEDLRYQLSSFVELRTKAFERELLTKKVTQFKELLSNSKSGADSTVKSSIDKTLDQTALNSFCTEVENLLDSWGVPFSHPVTFDQHSKILDLKLGTEPRTNSGKGLRAITYSAFMLGLLLHCKKEQIPHCNLIILDSPLTTYKERQTNIGREDLPKSIQANVFREIAEQFVNEQVIIIENEEPPLDVAKYINFIRFTQDIKYGRYGFFPKLN